MKPILAAIAVALVAAQASAQQSVHIGVGGGVALPVGSFDTTYSAGAQGLVTLAIGPADQPVGVRLDYSYNGFQGRTTSGKTYRDTHISAVTANLVLAFKTGYLKPYLIGGGGWYPYREARDSTRSNGWGANGGAGIGFPLPGTSIGAFVEARYHAVNAAHSIRRKFVPVTLGILF